MNVCINQHYVTNAVDLINSINWNWIMQTWTGFMFAVTQSQAILQTEVCVHLLLTHDWCGGQLRPNRADLWRKVEGSYHYTQTVRRVKSLTGGNWIQVVTHSTSWSCSDGGLRTRHTHDHTRGHGPQSITHCLSKRQASARRAVNLDQ